MRGAHRGLRRRLECGAGNIASGRRARPNEGGPLPSTSQTTRRVDECRFLRDPHLDRCPSRDDRSRPAGGEPNGMPSSVTSGTMSFGDKMEAVKTKAERRPPELYRGLPKDRGPFSYFAESYVGGSFFGADVSICSLHSRSRRNLSLTLASFGRKRYTAKTQRRTTIPTAIHVGGEVQSIGGGPLGWTEQGSYFSLPKHHPCAFAQ